MERQIRFERGPTKLVYTCTGMPSHVVIVNEAPGASD